MRNNSVLTLQTDIGDLDLLAEVAGLGTYDFVKGRSEVVTAFHIKIAVLDIRGLIQAKRAAGREKDLAIIPKLESMLEAEENG